MRKWLSELRIQSGYTQEELAKELGISRSHLSSIEVGTRDPGGKTARKIAEKLNFDMALFFEDIGLETSQKDKSA